MLSAVSRVFVILSLALQCIFSTAAASDFPSKPVKIIVPFPPAGSTDLLARTLAQKLGEVWKQSVIVENRPGAGGNIGSALVAQAPADGYTLVLCTVSTHGINPSVYPNMPYDAVKDFAAVAFIARVSNVLMVHPAVKANSVQELIALAKAQPGKLMFASSGNGTSLHLSGELLATMAQIDITHVPYKGSAAALTDVASGQVPFMFDNLPSALPQIKAGKLRPLAVTMTRRISQLPEVPTMIEAGVPGFEAVSWFGLLAPAKTPLPLVTRMNADINAILSQPSMQKRLVELGAEPATMSPDEFSAHIKSEIVKWGKVVKVSGARVDQ